jgi:hypothetical protein
VPRSDAEGRAARFFACPCRSRPRERSHAYARPARAGCEADMIHFLGVGAQKRSRHCPGILIYGFRRGRKSLSGIAAAAVGGGVVDRSVCGRPSEAEAGRNHAGLRHAGRRYNSRNSRLVPNVHVFYSVRNSIARAWSSALMALERAEMTIDDASHLWFLDHFKSARS